MSTEQLKMILDAFTAMGANGKEAFVWWLLAEHAYLILWAAFIVLLARGAKHGLDVINAYSAIDEINEILDMPGYSTNKQAVVKKVRELVGRKP